LLFNTSNRRFNTSNRRFNTSLRRFNTSNRRFNTSNRRIYVFFSSFFCDLILFYHIHTLSFIIIPAASLSTTATMSAPPRFPSIDGLPPPPPPASFEDWWRRFGFALLFVPSGKQFTLCVFSFVCRVVLVPLRLKTGGAASVLYYCLCLLVSVSSVLFST
jgi:hypothetical protein